MCGDLKRQEGEDRRQVKWGQRQRRERGKEESKKEGGETEKKKVKKKREEKKRKEKRKKATAGEGEGFSYGSTVMPQWKESGAGLTLSTACPLSVGAGADKERRA